MATIASPRPSAELRERQFFLVMACVIGLLTVAGFALNIARGQAVTHPPLIFHIHALAYVGWLALFIAQSLFIVKNDVRLHRTLGIASLAWLPLMVILALAMTIASIRLHGGPPVLGVGEFLFVNATHAVSFAALSGVAIGMWRKTDWHRRLLLVGLASVGAPGIARLLPLPLFEPYVFPTLFLAAMAFPVIALAFDWRRTGRVHPAWLWGIGTVFAAMLVGQALAATPWGIGVTQGLIAGTPGRRATDGGVRSRRLGVARGPAGPYLGAIMNIDTRPPAGADLLAEIDRLRKERKAVILAHYYQRPELQDLADFVGDSLELSRKAADTDAEVIAFCGVKFMADTAKILSPDKIVVLPDMDAGCSLEDSCPPEKFKAFRAAHPGHIALTYINCSTEVKALSDVIVTSSSAETILQQIPKEQKIIFGPDRHLGGYLSRKFDREMLLWPGVCIVHEAFSETELMKLKAQHPDAPIAAHPECPPAILDHADYVGSTSGILKFAQSFPGDTLIVATEPHIIHQMQKALPDKTFIGAPGADGNCNCNICPYMALNTLEKLYLALRDLAPRIEIEEDLRLAAKRSLDRMLEMASGTVGKGDLGPAAG